MNQIKVRVCPSESTKIRRVECNLTRGYSPIGCGCRIHRLFICTGVRPHPNKCPGYGIKRLDSEAPVMLEIWGMRSTFSMLSLSGQLWPGELAPDRVLSMGQTELFDI